MARPRKNKLPINLDAWLRIVLRGKRPEDRFKIFREWRRSYLRQTLNREPIDSELENEIEQWNKNEFWLSHIEMQWIDNIRLDFLPKFHKENRSKRSSIASKARWNKKD